MTVRLAAVFALTLVAIAAAGRVAAEPSRVDPAKITGCWHVWNTGAPKEKGRDLQITRLTNDYRVEGQDARGIPLLGHFEPATISWFGYLGMLILHAPTDRARVAGSSSRHRWSVWRRTSPPASCSRSAIRRSPSFPARPRCHRPCLPDS